MSGIGKTTSLHTWNGKTLLNDQWIINAKFLDYNELRKNYSEFIDKQKNPWIELAYSLTHLMRTVTRNDGDHTGDILMNINHLLLVDRTCITNLVYYLLFFLKGDKSYDTLYKNFLQYDKKNEDLPAEVYNTIHDVETVVKIIGKEFARLRYYVIIAIPNNPFIILDSIKKRGYFDASFATIDYIRSQTFLFKRFADLMDKSVVSIMRVDTFLCIDEYQLKNHLQFNSPFY